MHVNPEIDQLGEMIQNLHSQSPVASNTKRPTKWSGHAKMIDPPRELLHTKDLLPERVNI